MSPNADAGGGDGVRIDALSSRTTDFREGLAAFREDRPPRFEGR